VREGRDARRDRGARQAWTRLGMRAARVPMTARVAGHRTKARQAP
jgi:hypothetical protein